MPYIQGPTIAFDPAKDAANRAKHGVSLVLAALVLEHRVGEVVDNRRDYGEVRVNAFGLIGERLYVCTYTLRGAVCRVISLRKASSKEQRQWRP